jgi:ribosomal protein S18 acetylase RimI-like enzyme
VDPTRQGCGIGKMIMQDVEENARQSGFDKLQLTVHPSNIQAVTFYEGTGWVKRLEKKGKWTGSMVKHLS